MLLRRIPFSLAVALLLATGVPGCRGRRPPGSGAPEAGASVQRPAPPTLAAAPREYLPADEVIQLVLPTAGGLFINTRAITHEQLAPFLREVFNGRQPRSVFVRACPGRDDDLRFVIAAAAGVQVRAFDLVRSFPGSPAASSPPSCAGYPESTRLTGTWLVWFVLEQPEQGSGAARGRRATAVIRFPRVGPDSAGEEIPGLPLKGRYSGDPANLGFRLCGGRPADLAAAGLRGDTAAIVLGPLCPAGALVMRALGGGGRFDGTWSHDVAGGARGRFRMDWQCEECIANALP